MRDSIASRQEINKPDKNYTWACVANDSSIRDVAQLRGSFTVGDFPNAYSSTRDTAIDVANVPKLVTCMVVQLK